MNVPVYKWELASLFYLINIGKIRELLKIPGTPERKFSLKKLAKRKNKYSALQFAKKDLSIVKKKWHSNC